MCSYIRSLEGSGCNVPTGTLQHGSNSGFYSEFTAVVSSPPVLINFTHCFFSSRAATKELTFSLNVWPWPRRLMQGRSVFSLVGLHTVLLPLPRRTAAGLRVPMRRSAEGEHRNPRWHRLRLGELFRQLHTAPPSHMSGRASDSFNKISSICIADCVTDTQRQAHLAQGFTSQLGFTVGTDTIQLLVCMSLRGISWPVWALSECEQTKSSFSVERSCARTPGDTHLGSVGFSTADQGVTYFPVLSRPGNKSFSGFNVPSSHHPLRLVLLHRAPPEPHPVLRLWDSITPILRHSRFAVMGGGGISFLTG